MFVSKPTSRSTKLLKVLKNYLYPNRLAGRHLPLLYSLATLSRPIRWTYVDTVRFLNKSQLNQSLTDLTQELFLGKKLTSDLITGSMPLWVHFFPAYKDTTFSTLEIGSYEGASALFTAWLFPKAKLTCIDLFENDRLETFLGNTRHLADRVTALKGTSYRHLVSLNQDPANQYDFIYIDGSHFYKDVLLDSFLSWPMLRVGGILVWDDYLWEYKPFKKMQPRPAIDKFLEIYEGNYRLIFAYRQVAIEKTSADEPLARQRERVTVPSNAPIRA